MPRLQKASVERFNRIIKAESLRRQNRHLFENFPKLETGKCYVGRVVRFGKMSDPIVFQSPNNPAVVLDDCGDAQIEIGELVSYEVTYIGPKCAFGKFIEVYQT